MPRTRPPHPEEFRREAIKLAMLGDKPQRKLAKDLGISDVTLRNWLKQEKAERGERPDGLSSASDRRHCVMSARMRVAWTVSRPGPGSVGASTSVSEPEPERREPPQLVAVDQVSKPLDGPVHLLGGRLTFRAVLRLQAARHEPRDHRPEGPDAEAGLHRSRFSVRRAIHSRADSEAALKTSVRTNYGPWHRLYAR